MKGQADKGNILDENCQHSSDYQSVSELGGLITDNTVKTREAELVTL